MDHREFLRKAGAKGGAAGTGATKRRGNSDYYRRLATGRVPGNAKQRRKAKRIAQQSKAA